MTETNAIANVNTETGELLPTEMIVNETADYTIVKLVDGTFKKNMKYKNYHSIVPVKEEDVIELYKVFNDSDNDLVTPLKNMIKKELVIKNVFMNPYQSFDEKTGNVTNGVSTTIQDVDGSYYATSSKSVYYTLNNLMESFGYPNTESYKPLKVLVTGTQQSRGVQIDLSLIGIA